MDAALSSFALFALIAVALLFDALNGVHDAANSIATVVSTRVLRPHYAVAWAAFFNFIAFLFFGVHVAQTVGTGIVAAEVVDAAVIFGALMGAIAWNLITWWLGLPLEQLPCSHRRTCRGWRDQGRARRDRLARPRHHVRGDRSFAIARVFPGVAAGARSLVDVRPFDTYGGGQFLSLRTTALGRTLLAGARGK
jgi:hypothetical protein